MGLKFRKSVKIAPGVRLNVSKKSASVSVGGKGFHKTFSTTGKTTTTVGIPGTGLSYSKTSKKAAAPKQKKPSLFSSIKDLANKSVLLEWQNVILEDESTKLHMSRDQLEDCTIEQAQNDMRIFDDCATLINSTVKPDVFFSRLDLAESTLDHLVTLEPYMNQIKCIQLEASMSDLMNKFQEEKDSYTTDFLYRYYASVKEKADGLKTEKGKQNQFQKFYESLEPYFESISDLNMEYIEAMKEQKI